MASRSFAVGDIHGCAGHLDALLARLAPTFEDTIIFLGDYVDRGADAAAVISRLLRLRACCRAVFIKGNHDELMLHAREDDQVRRAWIRYGGDATIASYGGRFPEGVPQEHWDFLEACVDWHETSDHILVHSPIRADVSIAEQSAEEWRWSFTIPEARHISGKWVVCGHCSQHDGLPVVIGGSVLIDTWAHGGQWLTALDLRTGELTQANAEGQTRSWDWNDVAARAR